MRSPLILIIGLIALLLVIIYSINTDAPRIARVLTDKTNAVLDEQSVSHINTQVKGRDVYLTGQLNLQSEQTQSTGEQWLNTIRNIWGVRKVHSNDLTVAQVAVATPAVIEPVVEPSPVEVEVEPEPEPVAAVVEPIPEPINTACELSSNNDHVRIQFNYDSSQVQPFDELEKLNLKMQQCEKLQGRIIGYTDSKGSELYNQKLGLQRATSVRQWFISNKISLQRLTTQSKGELEPIDSNNTEQGRANNRRVEVTVFAN